MSETARILRLITGEEIVALVDIKMEVMTVTKPVQLIVSPPQAPGQSPRMGFAPFVPYFDFKDDTFDIDRRHVMFYAPVDGNLEDVYRKTVGLTPRIMTEKDRKIILP
jgi:hypothetical protein